MRNTLVIKRDVLFGNCLGKHTTDYTVLVKIMTITSVYLVICRVIR